MRIQGNGAGNFAEVSDSQRLLVDSVQRNEHLDAADNANSYYFSTGFINISAASGVFHLINDDAHSLHIYSVRCCSEDASAKVVMYKNSTAGTLISNAVAGNSENSDFGAAATAEATVYKGVNGDTITDGNVFSTVAIGSGAGHAEIIPGGALVLQTGKSVSIEMTPSAASDVCVTVLAYYKAHD